MPHPSLALHCSWHIINCYQELELLDNISQLHSIKEDLLGDYGTDGLEPEDSSDYTNEVIIVLTQCSRLPAFSSTMFKPAVSQCGETKEP